MPVPEHRLAELAARERGISAEESRDLIPAITQLFKDSALAEGHDPRQILRLTTKFRDSGRRSPPWRPTSSRVPGRPQDGADGNRINRWQLPETHKFYADEVTATLVEVKYYLQALSMRNAPPLVNRRLSNAFVWLLGHSVEVDAYIDPIQLVSIDFLEIIRDPQLIQSGHLIPLDRGGRHEPNNAFLMLARSNQLQGNLSVQELLSLMSDILARHKQRADELRRTTSMAAGSDHHVVEDHDH